MSFDYPDRSGQGGQRDGDGESEAVGRGARAIERGAIAGARLCWSE